MPCVTHDCTHQLIISASQHQDTEKSYLILYETAFPWAQKRQRTSNDVRFYSVIREEQGLTDGLQWTCSYLSKILHACSVNIMF